MVCFVAVICAACSIMGVQHVRKKFMRANEQDCDDELSSPFFDILYVFGGMTGQGLQKVPRDLPVRIIMLSLLMMGMLLSYGFSSTLTSCLASKGNSVALDDLEDVAVKRTHSLCVRNNSGAYRHFTVDSRPDSELQDKWKGLVNKDCPDMMDTRTLASKMCRPGFVYLEVPGVFLPIYRAVEHICELLQLQKTRWERKMSFMHLRMAPHRRLIDAYLMRMRSAGILAYLEKKWVLQEFNTPASHVQSSTFQPVEYAHIRLTICLLVTMMLVSAVICILENAWYKLQEKSRGEDSDLMSPRRRRLNLARARQARSRLRRRDKPNSILLLDANNCEFFRDVTVRIDRWQTSRSYIHTREL
ncbi:hypothetical protein HN011_000357 [Eciton burchellii]|nr:hypothetical protein HN011_000357 [Eciton burchellii]